MWCLKYFYQIIRHLSCLLLHTGFWRRRFPLHHQGNNYSHGQLHLSCLRLWRAVSDPHPSGEWLVNGTYDNPWKPSCKQSCVLISCIQRREKPRTKLPVYESECSSGFAHSCYHTGNQKERYQGGMCIITWASAGILTVKQAVNNISIELRAVFQSIS